MASEEMVNYYSPDGEVLGVIDRVTAEAGDYILDAAIVFVMTEDGKVLTQRRAKTKQYWPNVFDVSAAGAVAHPEEPYEAAGRELLEETGLELDLLLVDKFMHSFPGIKPDTTMKRIVSLYVAMSDSEVEISPNREVSGFEWQHYQELLDLSMACPQLFVPAYRPELVLAVDFALEKALIKE